MGLPAPWVRHLKDSEAKNKLEQSVLASSTALSRLYDLLEESERVLDTEETTVADYESPSWPYKQAFRNGQRAKIRELKQLLTFTKRN